MVPWSLMLKAVFGGDYAAGSPAIAGTWGPGTLAMAQPADACRVGPVLPATGSAGWVVFAEPTDQCACADQVGNARASGAAVVLLALDDTHRQGCSHDTVPATPLILLPAPDHDRARELAMSGTAQVTILGRGASGARVVVSEGGSRRVSLGLLIGTLALLFVFCCLLCLLVRLSSSGSLPRVPDCISQSAASKARAARRVALDHMPTVPYDGECRTASTYKSCPICLDDFNEGDQLRVLPCGHAYHPACIDQWVVDRGQCPYCNAHFEPASLASEGAASPA